MNRIKARPWHVAGMCVLAILAIAAEGAVRNPLAEKPAEVMISKYKIEMPTKLIVSAQSALAATPAKSDNPKVQPGLVQWHSTFEEACQAANISKKPVLLFQMMGKLDDQFC